MKRCPIKINLQLKKHHDGCMLSKLIISTAGRNKPRLVFQHNHKTLSIVAGRDTAAFGGSVS